MKFTSLAGSAFYLNASAMCLYDLPGDCQTKPGSIFLKGYKRLEDLVLLISFY